VVLLLFAVAGQEKGKTALAERRDRLKLAAGSDERIMV
jgi:hypothetical protein